MPDGRLLKGRLTAPDAAGTAWFMLTCPPANLVRSYLLPTERIVTAVRMHPIAVIGPAMVILAGAVVAGFVTESAAQSGSLGGTPIIWVLWAVLAVWQGWKIATWWRRYFVVTENRLMLITSLLDTDVGMMPLAKVTDMRLHRTTLGHALGYAEFIVESAGQDQALSRINFVPYPSQMYQEILALIFSPRRSGGNGGDLGLNWLRGIAGCGRRGTGYGTSPACNR